MNLSNYYQYNRVCIFKCDFYVIRLLRLYKSIEINRNFVRFKNSKYKYIYKLRITSLSLYVRNWKKWFDGQSITMEWNEKKHIYAL